MRTEIKYKGQKTHTQECKREVVQLAQRSGKPNAPVAGELDIPLVAQGVG